MLNRKNFLDKATRAVKKDVGKPRSLNMSNPYRFFGTSNSTGPASDANRSVTSNWEADMQSGIERARDRLFGARRPFSTLSDAPRRDELSDAPRRDEFFKEYTAKDGTKVSLEPAGPDDVRCVPGFYDSLSEKTIGFRWIGGSNKAHIEALQEAFRNGTGYAVRKDKKELIGIGELTPSTALEDDGWATRSIVIADSHQGKGIGTFMMDELRLRAGDKDFIGINASFDINNVRVRHWWEKNGAEIYQPRGGGNMMMAKLKL